MKYLIFGTRNLKFLYFSARFIPERVFTDSLWNGTIDELNVVTSGEK